MTAIAMYITDRIQSVFGTLPGASRGAGRCRRGDVDGVSHRPPDGGVASPSRVDVSASAPAIGISRRVAFDASARAAVAHGGRVSVAGRPSPSIAPWCATRRRREGHVETKRRPCGFWKVRCASVRRAFSAEPFEQRAVPGFARVDERSAFADHRSVCCDRKESSALMKGDALAARAWCQLLAKPGWV
jgi:hypothetical protein